MNTLQQLERDAGIVFMGYNLAHILSLFRYCFVIAQ